MKKLIFTQHIEKAREKGESTIYVDKNTIITPLARDLAQTYEIEFLEKEQYCKPNKLDELGRLAKSIEEQMDMDIVYKVFNLMKEKGLLEDILNWLSDKPYIFKGNIGGFKVIRGNSIRLNRYDTHNPKDKVYYQQLIKKEEPDLIAGILTIESSKLGRKLTHNEIGYVIDGQVNIEVDGQNIVAYTGDIFHIPMGSQVILDSGDNTKLFYVKYKADKAVA